MDIVIEGFHIKVDSEDYERIQQFNWALRKRDYKKCGRAYFRSSFTDEHGKSKEIALHRFILNLQPNDGIVCDHINGDTLDNRKENLRKCTNAENIRNQKLSKRNTTGYKGVTIGKGSKKYCAHIRYLGKPYHLGYYDTAEEAHAAYCEASKKYHGEFGRTE